MCEQVVTWVRRGKGKDHKFKNLTGQRFGRLVALEAVRVALRWRWRCLCDCGNEIVTRSQNLTSGLSQSCGCYHRDLLRKKCGPDNPSWKGGFSTQHRPEWHSYNAAKTRCTNPRRKCWKDYGGRGIKFLFTSFEQFFAHIGPRPAGTTLDRIENDGNYELGNVRWATRKQQTNNNRRSLCKKV